MALAFSLVVLSLGAFLLWIGWKGYSFAEGFAKLGLGGKAA